MIQHFYQEQTNSSNITYAVLSRNVISKKKLYNLSNYTVIIVTDEMTDANLMRDTAEEVLKRGCKNIVLGGMEAEEWQDVFEQKDCELNGFNDITGYEDFAVIRRFDDLEELPEEISMCWGEALVLCSNMALLRECQIAMD